MKPATVKELQEAINILDFAAGNMGQNNLEDTKEDIHNALEHIRSAIFMETPTTGRKFDLYKYTTDDQTRPVMCGIFHDEGFKVASDSHVLVAVKEPYSENLEHHIIGKKGEDIVGKYPKWKCLFEMGSLSSDGEHEIDTEAVYSLVREMKAEKKAAGKYGAYRRAYVRVGDTFFNAERFALICSFMDAYGAKTIKTYGPRHAALVECECGSRALIMPISYLDYPDGKGYTVRERPIREALETKRDSCLWYEVA